MNSKLIIKRMFHSKFFMIGFITCVLIVIFALVGPSFVVYDAEKNSLTEQFLKPEWLSNGWQGHILGTDELGRDEFTRLVVGARYSLAIALVVTVCSAVLGTILGMIAGYLGGVADVVIMRMCDVFLSIPNLILSIAIIAVLGTSTTNLIIVLIISSWVQYCKLSRNNVMVTKKMEFVSASKCLGATNSHIIFKEIFPNITTQLIILVSQQFGNVILVEAALSFMNLGISPPTPSWGNMIAGGRTYLTTYPWLCVVPGMALMVTVLAFNFLGDGVRDVLDPKRT